ncbi:tetratricopeptide repeat protein [Pseudoduganella ginsengisoli]|uniref:Tetratricopeptide repeat protein n=1 Tax=Pseudoduganella ginsengisoli TaxID=1462440 RepID=A0A6L6Q827_9BURK|nr:tetratricopeptide repeat protein [Pseudoduganella ginsengisoli]MTW05937.1 hypothetical protein [Pseudoduganella ginsengisoli]
MPIFGLGIHILIALLFAVHVVRTHQQLYWLLILFSFPMLGSIVYFFAIYLPNSRLEHGARKAVAAAARTLDPGRELREAQAAFELTPTAQNQMRLAYAQLDAGNAQEAAGTFESCLNGVFGADLEVRRGAARANLACGRVDAAVAHLDFIRRADPNFRAEETAILRAQALGAAGRIADAKAAFAEALERFNSFAVRAEYIIWARSAGEQALADSLRPELEKTMQYWNRHTRGMNAELLKRLGM